MKTETDREIQLLAYESIKVIVKKKKKTAVIWLKKKHRTSEDPQSIHYILAIKFVQNLKPQFVQRLKGSNLFTCSQNLNVKLVCVRQMLWFLSDTWNDITGVCSRAFTCLLSSSLSTAPFSFSFIWNGPNQRFERFLITRDVSSCCVCVMFVLLRWLRLRGNEQRAKVLQQEREYYSTQARTLQQSLSQLTADKQQTEAELKVTQHDSADWPRLISLNIIFTF